MRTTPAAFAGLIEINRGEEAVRLSLSEAHPVTRVAKGETAGARSAVPPDEKTPLL